jgi:predicted amidophosphoribosyltransferase
VRGYNQSLYFAKGISEITKIPIDEKTLIRTKENISQTRKTKYERWENVDSIFETEKSENIIGKHLLLVDDIITTGATLEACIHALKKAENVKVSIFTIATAGK